jgi:glucose/mannose transport system substrate-binding protein
VNRRNVRHWPAWALLYVLACTGGESRSNVEIYSWWKSPSESGALDAVRDDFEKNNPNFHLLNAASSNSLLAQDELQARMRLNDPPDTFQVNGGAQLFAYLVDPNNPNIPSNQLKPLDFLFGDGGAPPFFPPDIAKAITSKNDGRVYAVPVDIARVNCLFYNPMFFAGLPPPTTVDLFVQDAEQIAKLGLTDGVLAVGASAPWTLEVIFKGCLAAVKPGYYLWFIEGYDTSFFGGDADAADSTFNQALDCFSKIMRYADPNMHDYTWDIAVKHVAEGTAAMTIMGDWAVGEFAKDQMPVGNPIVEVPAPGSENTFIFTTDTFVLPSGAKNGAGARALLKEWASKDGQGLFYESKGSLPARSDVDLDAGQAIAMFNAFQAAEDAGNVVPDWPIAISQAFSNAFDPALDRFVADHNEENVVLAARNYYDVIHEQPYRP